MSDGPIADQERRAHAEVLAVVSHDIRSPLGVILGAVGELLGPSVGSLNDEQRALVQIVRRSSERLGRLAANVLVLNRAALGKLELHPQTLDARVVLRRALESFERAGELGRLTVDAALGDEPAGIECDPERIGHAVVNLLANAVRFARARLRVEVARQGGDVALTVEDDGPGIGADQLTYYFDRATAPVPGEEAPSRGLGLVVARALVDAHGGRLVAEPVVATDAPRGARVTIRLPAL